MSHGIATSRLIAFSTASSVFEKFLEILGTNKISKKAARAEISTLLKWFDMLGDDGDGGDNEGCCDGCGKGSGGNELSYHC